MGRLFHNLTTVSLVAAVLGGSLLSPGVRHAHSQGDVAHSHVAEAASHESHHGHLHGKSHTHHSDHSLESDSHSRKELTDLVGHWHISLLGIEFTIPQDGVPGEPFPQCEGELVVLRLTPDVTLSFAVALTDLVDLSSETTVFDDRSDVEPAGSVIALVLPVDRILLCDSARCERSGVLLT